jgi:transcriptional regulator with XRE-family HTH domain
MSAGLSLRHLEQATGVSRSRLSRLERSLAPEVSLRTLTVVFAVLGMRLSVRPYTEGAPLRDDAHARLLRRFRARLAPTIRMRTEVPLGIDGDLRAWDGELLVAGETCKLEAETVLYDLQATDRRIALKMADDHVDRVILLVAATRRNRRVLREFGGLIAERYPLGTREVMAALAAGRLPERSGVVLL